MTTKIYPYKMSSQSGKVLAHALGATRVYPNRNYKPKPNHLVINWGSSYYPDWYNYTYKDILNKPGYIALATNKQTTFNSFLATGVPHPEWTNDTECAQSWVDDGFLVYGRKTLTGHSGQGITIFDSETITTNQECPLYTKETKAKDEYRIHIGDNGETVIDFVQKKKKATFEGSVPGIRSHNNGWIFAREGINVPTCVLDAAKSAIRALGLDFGACDVGYNKREDKAYVYEVNTAPGLQGTTLTRYVEYFQRKANENI